MKIKKILSMLVISAVLAASLAGCNENKESNPQEQSSTSSVSSQESGSSSTSSKENSSSSSSQESGSGSSSKESDSSSETEKFTLVISDEIKNADFSSGKVQINNDIFQLGASVTVEDFVEKYKDSYDITYLGGTYEERKDYLLEYQNYEDASSRYELEMKPKIDGASKLHVLIDNVTSPDEKITLDKAVVIGFDYQTMYHAILPGGFLVKNVVAEVKSEGLENPNDGYNLKTIPEYFESLGLKLCEVERFSNPLVTSPDDKFYWKNLGSAADRWCVKLCGEKGLNGKIPVYTYDFVFDGNTDKLAYVEFSYFYKAFE